MSQSKKKQSKVKSLVARKYFHMFIEDITYKNKNVKKYTFSDNVWGDLLGPEADKKVQEKFINILKHVPFESYYLESPNIPSPDSPLEFVLVESKTLHNKDANWKMYKEYMKKQPGGFSAVSFDNLSGETRLTIPLNKKGDYGHLADFMRNAPQKEITEILFEAGQQIHEYWAEKGSVYFSTHGDGVPWIHFRVETEPKYYSYSPYKK